MENNQAEQNTQKEANQKGRINNAVHAMTGGNKTAGIIIAICMVILGMLIFAAPLIVGLGIAYLITIGFILYGVFSIVSYARIPSDERNGWTLANGIIFVLVGILILAEALGNKFGQLSMLSMFSFLIGFFALFGGINQIASYGALKKAGEDKAGWVLASGIINLILGIMIICAPIMGWFTLEMIFAIYLIVGGIALFAEACSGKLARK